MRIYRFYCKNCGYETRLPLGSSDLDQVLSDVNLDYAQYCLFRCKVDSKFVHADVHDLDFEGRCPFDDSKLEKIDRDVFCLECPRCGKPLSTEESEPILSTSN
jgi:hypothetical protein